MYEKFPKLTEFTKDELMEQYMSGVIDVNFLIDYTIARDKMFNKLIDYVRKLEGEQVGEHITNIEYSQLVNDEKDE